MFDGAVAALLAAVMVYRDWNGWKSVWGIVITVFFIMVPITGLSLLGALIRLWAEKAQQDGG